MATASAAVRPTKGHRVLVVEDEADLRELVAYNLEAAGYDVRAVESGEQGMEVLEDFGPEVIILDLMLPGMSGIEFCRRVRSSVELEQPAILMLTAKAEEIDRVVGFEVGADDYVVKPCSMRELTLRVTAILRRAEANRPTRERPLTEEAGGRRSLAAGPIKVDVDGYRVFVAESEVHVSGLEMRLLVYLLEGKGRVRTREDLLRDVWGYRSGVSTRTVDTHVKRLRDKLGPEGGALIETVRGVGYRFSD